MWWIMAVLSAVFAGLTSILIKCGIKKTDPHIATAWRTVVVLLFSWLMVWAVGSLESITRIDGRSFLFLILSGVATGASWICYFKALSIGNINQVVPIDRSSTILSVILAIFLFNETDHLAVKLIGTTVLAIGIYLMIEKNGDEKKTQDHKWILFAILSAVFAALTSILAKIGIAGVESNLGTAIRTGVILLLSFLAVFAKGKQKQIWRMDRKELLFIALSGVATGASWLCYYYAIQNGVVSIVIPIDKMSLLITVLFSYLVFKERLSKRALLGLLLMLAGTLVMALWG